MLNYRCKLKRYLDVLIASVSLLLFSPLILVCAIAARLSTNQSGFFAQYRVGLNGELFKLWKIRTMTSIKEYDSNTITTSNDHRLTKLGRFLRKWKLDELPQLWCVLIGDMSLVGPRPDVPGYADKLEGEYRQILTLRPGITGPASIKYREEEVLLGLSANPKQVNDELIYPDKVKINLDYQKNYSFKLDLLYILVTLKVLSIPDKLLLSSEVLDNFK